MEAATHHVLQQVLLYGLLPLWLLAGLGDWACHRVQRIEHTSGLKESLLHLLMLAQLGAAVGMALLLQVNAALLTCLLALAIAHELTIWWDLRYASSRREIPVYEQWVHAWQQALPWTALAALALLHRDQAGAAPGLVATPADWSLRLKSPALPAATVLALAAGAMVLVVGPFTQEAWRCWRAFRAGQGGRA